MQVFVGDGRSAGARALRVAWSLWVCLVWAQQLMACLPWQRPARGQRAQAFIEYAILAGLLGVGIIVALTAFAPQLAGVFNRFGIRLGSMG